MEKINHNLYNKDEEGAFIKPSIKQRSKKIYNKNLVRICSKLKKGRMKKMQEIDNRKLSKKLQTKFRKRTVRAIKKGNTKTSAAECLRASRNTITK